MRHIQMLSTLAGLEDTDLSPTWAAVIDVFRASTTVLCLMEHGADEVTVTGSVQSALDWKKKGYVVIGERAGHRVAGFDLDNSPYQVSQREWDSHSPVLTTSNGTRALVAVRESARVIMAGFRNLDAAADYLLGSNQHQIALIPIGASGEPRAEDELCAHALKARLRNEPVDVDSVIARVRQERCEAIASRGTSFQRDVDLALQLNTTRIVPVLGEGLKLHRVLA